MKKMMHNFLLTLFLPNVAFGAAALSGTIRFIRTAPSPGVVHETYSTSCVTTTFFKEGAGNWYYKIHFHQPISNAAEHKKLANYARSLPLLYAAQQEKESKKRTA